MSTIFVHLPSVSGLWSVYSSWSAGFINAIDVDGVDWIGDITGDEFTYAFGIRVLRTASSTPTFIGKFVFVFVFVARIDVECIFIGIHWFIVIIFALDDERW